MWCWKNCYCCGRQSTYAVSLFSGGKNIASLKLYYINFYLLCLLCGKKHCYVLKIHLGLRNSKAGASVRINSGQNKVRVDSATEKSVYPMLEVILIVRILLRLCSSSKLLFGHKVISRERSVFSPVMQKSLTQRRDHIIC